MADAILSVERSRSAKPNGDTYDVVRERTASITVGDRTLTASTVAIENGVAAAGADEAAQFGLSRNANLANRLSVVFGELELDRIFVGEAKAGGGDASTSATYGGKAVTLPWGWQVPAVALRSGIGDTAYTAGRAATTYTSVGDAGPDGRVSLANPGHVALGGSVARAEIRDAGHVLAHQPAVHIDVRRAGHITAMAGGVEVQAMDVGHITLGDGGNRVTATGTGHIQSGAGNDAIVAARVGQISAGDGDNDINAQVAGNVLAGMGNDRIVGVNVSNVFAAGGDNSINLSNAGHVTAWGGNDTVVASKVGHIDVGDGNNRIVAATALDIFVGRGADEIAATDVRDIDAGDGDNRIAVQDAGNVRAGAGADRVVASDARSVDSGGGDDEIDATDVRLVVGGAGNDRISLERATALYRRGDGSDTIRAGEGAQVAFWDVKAADVDIKRVTDAEGAVVALDVTLKDSSGRVRVERGPNGAADAVLRFADGATMRFADALPKRGAAESASPFPDLLDTMAGATVFAARSDDMRNRRAMFEVDVARAAAELGRAPSTSTMARLQGYFHASGGGTTFLSRDNIDLAAMERAANPAVRAAYESSAFGREESLRRTQYVRETMERNAAAPRERDAKDEIVARTNALRAEFGLVFRAELQMPLRPKQEFYAAWGSGPDGEVKAVRIARFDGGPGHALIIRGKNGWRDATFMFDDPKHMDARYLADVLEHLIAGRYKRPPLIWA